MLSLIGWVYNREAGDLSRHRAQYNVIVTGNISYRYHVLVEIISCHSRAGDTVRYFRKCRSFMCVIIWKYNQIANCLIYLTYFCKQPFSLQRTFSCKMNKSVFTETYSPLGDAEYELGSVSIVCMGKYAIWLSYPKDESRITVGLTEKFIWNRLSKICRHLEGKWLIRGPETRKDNQTHSLKLRIRIS